jgi:hypothetical protein
MKLLSCRVTPRVFTIWNIIELRTMDGQHIRCGIYVAQSTNKFSAFFVNVDFSKPCKCRICLRHPPSLWGLACYTLFHFVYNINQFQLSFSITYEQYVYVVHLKTGSVERFVPETYPTLWVDIAYSSFDYVQWCHINCYPRILWFKSATLMEKNRKHLSVKKIWSQIWYHTEKMVV